MTIYLTPEQSAKLKHLREKKENEKFNKYMETIKKVDLAKISADSIKEHVEKLLSEILDFEEKLSGNEYDFVHSLILCIEQEPFKISEKQLNWLRSIHARLT